MKYSKYIDHTLLKPEAVESEIVSLCSEARQYDFCSVCINPKFVPLAKKCLEGTDVKVCTVIGFPLGANSTETKVFETKDAISNGADEIDVVLSIGDLKAHRKDLLVEEISKVKEACKDRILKVIIETCLLTDEEKVLACQASLEAKADFVKTSTGFSKGGATVHDVKLMKDAVKDQALVKASGGVKTAQDFLAMIEAGASRIGASSGIKIMEGLKELGK